MGSLELETKPTRFQHFQPHISGFLKVLQVLKLSQKFLDFLNRVLRLLVQELLGQLQYYLVTGSIVPTIKMVATVTAFIASTSRPFYAFGLGTRFSSFDSSELSSSSSLRSLLLLSVLFFFSPFSPSSVQDPSPTTFAAGNQSKLHTILTCFFGS